MGPENTRRAAQIVKKMDKLVVIKDIRKELPWHPTRRWNVRPESKITRIVVHTSASSNQNPFDTNHYHITPSKDNHISKLGCSHICYHNFINKDGLVYWCNDYTDITWHCGLWNSSSIGIVMAFRGQDEGVKPTDEQYLSMIGQAANLCKQFNVDPNNVIGHREVLGVYTILGNGSRRYKKVCPGMSLDLSFLRKNVMMTLQARMFSEGFYHSGIDGLWGKYSKKAFSEYTNGKK